MSARETLDLARMDDAAIEGFIEAQIAPLLAQFKTPQTQAWRTLRRRLVIAAPIAFGGATVLALVFGAQELSGFVGVVGLLGAWLYASGPLMKLQSTVKRTVLETIAERIGVGYGPNPHSEAPVREMRALGLLPDHDISACEDWFHGARAGCAFEFFEADLKSERSDSDGDRRKETVFRGQIVRIQFPKAFEGVTIVRRDGGVLNPMQAIGAKARGVALKRVGLVDPQFEKTFEVYATDQVEARYLAHPAFIERLMDVEAAFKGKRVRCAFVDGDLLIAIEGGNRFEVQMVTKAVTDLTSAREILGDVRQILRLMDAVLTAEKAPLIGR